MRFSNVRLQIMVVGLITICGVLAIWFLDDHGPTQVNASATETSPRSSGGAVSEVHSPTLTPSANFLIHASTPAPILTVALQVTNRETNIPRTVAEAEAEGAAYPVATPPELLQAGFAMPSHGIKERVCVNVLPGPLDDGVWRSGDIVAGNFSWYLDYKLDHPDEGKLWWQPLHYEPMLGVTLRTMRIDEAGRFNDPAVLRFSTIASNAPPPGVGVNLFYPSAVPLTMPGIWMIIATSGPDWGCFILNLPEPSS